MTPQELKNSILQLAIQGKLTKQLLKEGNAKELLYKVSMSDKVDGRRVKQKSITPIEDSDKHFEIPENWTWIKLGAVCVIARGGSPRPIKEYITTEKNGVNWIKIGDTEKNGKYISSTAEKIKPSGVEKSRMVHAGDFLLTNSMSFGRPYILKIDGCIHDGWLVISQMNEIFDQDYLYWMLSSNYAYMQFCGKVSGAVVKNLNSDKVANSVFPLPPLAEQKRIVCKIEELLPYIERYEQAWCKLEKFNSRFPEDMKKSLLQYAIQGKLVEQRFEEGTAEKLFEQIQEEKHRLIKEKKIKKEKPLPEITDDEKPFDIPESWKWVRVGEIFAHNTGKAMNSSAKKVNKAGAKRKFITTSNLYWNSFDFSSVKEMFFSDDELERCTVRKGDLLMCEGGAYYGRTAIWNYDYDICFQNHIHRLRSYKPVELLFFYHLFYFYKSMNMMKAKGTAMPGLSSQTLHQMVLPLPPLSEQKRIVEKLERLVPLCDQLK